MNNTRVIKRDGRIVKFNSEKIAIAVAKAMKAIGEADDGFSAKIAEKVVSILNGSKEIPVEEIQDKVETALIESGRARLAKEYILYRAKRAQERGVREALGIEDDLKFGINAISLLDKRYLKTFDGKKETPSQMIKRVAKAVAAVEKSYGSNPDYWSKTFYNLMSNKLFYPNTPCLANAGNKDLNYLFACYTFEIQDSMDSIFQTVKDSAIVQQSGGGVGLHLSKLRPAGSPVKSTEGVASGPISFMKVFDVTSDVIKQGGCITNDTLVRTSSGIKPIGELINCRVNTDNPTSDSVMTAVGQRPAYLAKNNGLANTLLLKTLIGTELKATEDHRIAFVTKDGEIGFKPIKDMVRGDWVVTVLGGICGDEQKVIPVGKGHYNEQPIQYPETLTPELAEFIGLYMADGCINSNRLTISCNTNDKQEIDHITKLTKNLFNLACDHNVRGNTTDIWVSSSALCRLFKINGWKKAGRANTACIPESILLSPASVARAFIRGYFEGDGYVDKNGYACITSTSKKLVSQMQELLMSVGIISRVSSLKNSAGHLGRLPQYGLRIITERSNLSFVSDIGFISNYKTLSLAQSLKRQTEYSDIIPNIGKRLKNLLHKPTSKYDLDHYIYNGNSHRDITRRRLLSLVGKHPELDALRDILQPNLFFTKVASVESCGKEPTMDLEVPETSSFVANGLLIHNIRRGGNLGLLRVDHPDIIDFIKSKSDENTLNNFNISVAITDKFMQAVKDDTTFDLVNPKNGTIAQTVNARHLFRFIADSAWKNGEPGFIFWDKVQKGNPTPSKGELIVNLCGEQPLLPYEACFSAGTRVSTSRGLETVEDLYLKQEKGIDTYIATGLHDRPTEFSKTVITKIGEKEVVTVNLMNGQCLTVTPDHKIYTNAGWVEAGKLTKEHRVYIQKEATTKTVTDRCSEPLYEMLGWMVGDGWFTDSSFGLVFGKNDKDAQTKLVPIWNEFCGCNNNISRSNNRDDVCQIACERVEARKKLEELGFSSSYATTKRVPLSIFSAPANLQRAFIRGLFSAGGGLMWKPKPGVRLASSSLELLRDVQLICLGLGIKSRIGWYEAKQRGRSQGTLTITGKSYEYYANNIGFILNEKQHSMRKGAHLKADYLSIAVKSVTPAGVETVYDLYEPATNTLIANGMVVHNCCLGSINLEKFVEDGQIVYSSLRKVVHHATRFMDDVIDASSYPLQKISDMVKSNRKIGLGVMGFAHMLFRLGIPYDSEEAVKIGAEVMNFINNEAHKASARLADERGDFPSIKESLISSPQRNATLTTVAPTGSISIIAETSSGIEPAFAIVFQKSNILENNTFFEVDKVFEEIGKREGWFSQALINKIIKNGGKITGISEIPDKWQKVFRTALEISPSWHIKMQAAFQRNVDNAISKTVNMPFETKVEEVEKAIMDAYDANLKGMTLFRDRSRSKQVLETLCIDCEDDTASPPRE